MSIQNSFFTHEKYQDSVYQLYNRINLALIVKFDLMVITRNVLRVKIIQLFEIFSY